MSDRGRLRLVQRYAALALGIVILVVLWWRIDWCELGRAMSGARVVPLVIALALFVPQVVVMTWRWQLIGASARPLRFCEACRMVVAGSSLNVLLPSKLGDMCKGLMLGDEAGHGVAGGLGLAGLDKLMDMLGLAAVLAVAGCFAVPPEAWVLAFWLATIAGLVVLIVLMHRARPIDPLPHSRPLAALARALNDAIEVRRRRAAWAGSLGLSVFLWFLHVLQIYVFYRAIAGAEHAPAAAFFLRVPVAIFIGLLPVTVAGIGTRDGALFVLLAALGVETAVIALVGLFCILRYVVMALLGLPAILSLGPMLTRALRTARGPSKDVS